MGELPQPEPSVVPTQPQAIHNNPGPSGFLLLASCCGFLPTPQRPSSPSSLLSTSTRSARPTNSGCLSETQSATSGSAAAFPAARTARAAASPYRWDTSSL